MPEAPSKVLGRWSIEEIWGQSSGPQVQHLFPQFKKIDPPSHAYISLCEGQCRAASCGMIKSEKLVQK